MTNKQISELIFDMLMRHEGKVLNTELCYDRARNIAVAVGDQLEQEREKTVALLAACEAAADLIDENANHFEDQSVAGAVWRQCAEAIAKAKGR